MRIIEFYGLPGSGKSTAAKKIISEFRENGNTVIEENDYLEINNKKKLMLSSLGTSCGWRYMFRSLILLIRSKLLFKSDIAKRVFFCMSFIGFYKSYRKKEGIIVLDEGIIQSFISAFYSDPISDYNLKYLADTMRYFPVELVCVSVPVDLANDRIEQRNTKDHGRCDAINDREERKQVLACQKKNFDKVSSVLAGAEGIKISRYDGNTFSELNSEI